MKKMPLVLDIKNEKFIKALSTDTTKVYFVGGCVRDHLLGEKPKDIDLVVTGIDMPELVTILKKYGKADLVGESFGVIKFTPKDCENSLLKEMGVIDIAIPRVEINTGVGHKDFQIVASSDVTLEEDLLRRDFTINSMAMSMDAEIIDPYDGFHHLFQDVLNCTSTRSFIDDPLRVLRALRFACRFKLRIGPELHILLDHHSDRLSYITPERVLEEFRKTFESCGKEAQLRYIMLVCNYNLKIGGYTFKSRGKFTSEARTMHTFADFIYILASDVANKERWYTEVLKGDNTTAKELQTLSLLSESIGKGVHARKIMLIEAYKLSDIGDKSDLFLTKELLSFRSKELPRTVKDLAIKGDKVLDLLVYELGHPNTEVGVALKNIHQAVVLGTLKNTVEAGVWFIENNYKRRVIPNHQKYLNDITKSTRRELTPEAAWSRITG